jgi:hypothetical protein
VGVAFESAGVAFAAGTSACPSVLPLLLGAESAAVFRFLVLDSRVVSTGLELEARVRDALDLVTELLALAFDFVFGFAVG